MDSNIYLIYNELSKRIYDIHKDVINLSSTNLSDAILKTLIEEYFNAYEDMSYIACMTGGDFYRMIIDLQYDSINNLVNQYPDKAKKYKYIHRLIESK